MSTKGKGKTPAEAGAVPEEVRITTTPPRYGDHAVAWLHPFLLYAKGETEEAARDALLAKLQCPEADQVAAIMGDTLAARGLAADAVFSAGFQGGETVSEQQVARAANKIAGKARDLLTEIQASDPDLKALAVILRLSSKTTNRADMEPQFMESLRALAYPDGFDRALARGAGRTSEGDHSTWGTFALFNTWERITGEPPAYAERSRFARVAMVLLPLFGVEVNNWPDYLRRMISRRDTSKNHNV